MKTSKIITWPNEARVAVMITFELDAEYIWLSMDESNVSRPKTLSMGTYGPHRGLKRILNVLDNFQIKSTFFIPGRVAETYPEKVKDIIDRGHEVAHHGYKHENFGLLNEEEQREALIKGQSALTKICGVEPIGFRLPEGEMTKETLTILNDFGFKYSSSLHQSDYPYLMTAGNNKGSIIEIPTHWELHDFPYFAFNFYPPFPAGASRIANYQQVLGIWKDEFDGYYEYGRNFVMRFTPQIIGTPGRITLLENLLDYITKREKVWFCTGLEMYQYWTSYINSN